MQAQVLHENDTSKKFDVTNGVKQGCVLAPLLFPLYLTAMLEVAFDGVQEGIYIQTRHNANLFKVSQVQSTHPHNRKPSERNAGSNQLSHILNMDETLMRFELSGTRTLKFTGSRTVPILTCRVDKQLR